MSDTQVLSKALKERIDDWLRRYPPDQKRSGVIQALRFTQEEHKGFLTTELMNAVADYLGLPHIAVYEVASFYTMLNLEPVGRHIINVCTNISCMLQQSTEILAYLKSRLGIDLNETTPDGRFTLRAVECLAACAAAPVAHVGKKYYENLTPEKVDAMLNELE